MASLEIPDDLDLSNLTQKEKMLILDKLFFRILSSETDLDFEESLNIFLPKLLLKLGNSEEIIRKKIMEILVHINKRIKSRPNVQLPLDDLIEKFNESAVANLSFVTNFSLIYIKLGFPRLNETSKIEFLVKLFNSLEGKSSSHQDSIISLIIDGLKYLSLKPNENINKQKYGLENDSKLRKYFLDYLFYFLLLPYSISKPVQQPPAPTTTTTVTNVTPNQTAPATLQTAAPAAPEIPACMSEVIYKRFKNDLNLDDGDELERMKIGILKFLAVNIYTCEEVVFHFLISTSDTRYSVVECAEIHIKRLIGAVDLNDQQLVNRFFHIFLGDKALSKPKNSETGVIEPSNTRIRLKLFPYILRSKQAANTIPQGIQIVFDSLFGSPNFTNSKIKLYAIQFVHLIAENCDVEKLAKIGAVLVQGMNKVISEAKDDSKLRGLAYVAVGKLARRIPNTISSDISIVHNFFSALQNEDSDTKLHIQEALVLMMDAFRRSKPDEKNLLLTLLFQYVENEVSHCRSMAVKYAFEIFEHDHLESRYLLILASSDSKEEIRQEASKYLRRVTDFDGNDLKMASFEEWVDFISRKAEERLKTNTKVYTLGTHTLAFDLNCYQEILVILRLALSLSAKIKPQIVDAKVLESIREEACFLANYINKLGKENLNCLFKYVNIVKEYAMTTSNSLGIYLLLEICSISPLNITQILNQEIEWLKNQAMSVNEQVRYYAAELWSLVLINSITAQQNKNYDPLFSNLTSLSKANLINSTKSFECKHGTILCIGFALGKYFNLVKSSSISEAFKDSIKSLTLGIVSYLEDANLSQAAIISLGEVARNGQLIFSSQETKLNIVELLIKKIQTSKETNKLKEKAAATLGYLCIHETENTSEFVYKIDEKKSFNSFNKFVMQKLLNSSQAKQIDLHMAIGDALVNSALGKRSNASSNTWLINMNEDETSFSTNQIPDYDLTEDANLKWLLNELLANYLPNPNQHLRQAAAFWLLILVKKACKLSRVVADNLYQIQDGFIQRLGENDEITQEVASKGIGIIFSLANEDQKKSLVSTIVGSLGGGGDDKNKKAKAQQSTNLTAAESGLKIKDENEEILQDGQMGKTPEGGNIGTYKEICSLASDLNRPDLIYQFMNLAHHNSIWNTRKGAAFGFNTIAEIAREQLQPYLSDIVPKLFRYQFDPNPKIQQSMSSIWDSLIKHDNKKIVDLYLNEILTDLEQNMLSNLWRIRESCCNALCDLLKGGRNLETISGKFGTFWSLLFKLADDIKESVRGSAQIALKSLQRVTISYSSLVSNAVICEQTINSVLPILIKIGLQSNLNEVRNISVLTIKDLAKQASASLIKPYLIDMIISLLETLSGYEPPDLNYISLKLGSQDAQEKLDMARISASKNTPMVEIINMNLQYLNDDTIIGEFFPRLLDIVKKGLGVSTKAGVCSIICSLVDLQPQIMSKYSGKIMAALVNSMSAEQNKTINKSYCGAIGSIVKVAKESSIENLLNKLQEWYFEKDEDGIKLSCGLTLLAMVQNNPEITTKYSKKCIPFVFYAMHQQTEQQMKIKQQQLEQLQQNQFKIDLTRSNQYNQTSTSVWDDLWEEITSGTEYAIRANLNEILPMLKLGLEHQSWKLRIQSALAICTICSKLQSNIEVQYVNQILSMIISALNTRTWQGKDKVLIAVSCIFSNCKLILKIENPLIDELIKSIFKEANKKVETAYKVCALRCLSDLVQFSTSHFKDNHFEQFWSMFIEELFENDLNNLRNKEIQRLQQQIESIKLKNQPEITQEAKLQEVEGNKGNSSEEPTSEASQEKKETDKEEEEKNSSLKLVCLEIIGKCWPYTTEIQEKYLNDTSLLLSDNINKVAWTNQLTIIRSLNLIFDKWSVEFDDKNVEISTKSIESCTSAIISCIAKTKYSNLKREGITVLERISEIIRKEKSSSEFLNDLKSKNQSQETDEKIKLYLNAVRIENTIDNLKVLFDEFLSDSNLDIREKSKAISKILHSNF